MKNNIKMWPRLQTWATRFGVEGKTWMITLKISVGPLRFRLSPNEEWMNTRDVHMKNDWDPQLATRGYFSLDYFDYLRDVTRAVPLEVWKKQTVSIPPIDLSGETDGAKLPGGWKFYLYFLFAYIHKSLDVRTFPALLPRNIIADGSNHYLRFVRSIAVYEDKSIQVAVDVVGREWVVKASKDIWKEQNVYQMIRERGGVTLDFPDGLWYYGKEPVLVMERLLPLDHYDDEFEMARQILTTQLCYINTFAVYGDLKPDNIMKRNTPSGTAITVGTICARAFYPHFPLGQTGSSFADQLHV